MPRQNLGQHFLIDDKIRLAIAAEVPFDVDATIIEIGPGHGELTEPVLENFRNAGKQAIYSVIEKDPALAAELPHYFPEITVVEGDVREILGDVVAKADKKLPLYIIGNIPYYLTGFLLRLIEELPRHPEKTVLMIQKEVAERIAAKPPKMNLLAASVQYWASTSLKFLVPKEAFDPMPEVVSAVIVIDSKNEKKISPSAEIYYPCIKKIFKQPRKTLFNNLRDGYDLPKEKIEELLAACKISPQTRASELSIDDLKRLATVFS